MVSAELITINLMNMKELLRKAFEAGKDKQYDIEWQMGRSKPNFDEWYKEHENQALTIPVVVKSFYCLDEVHRGKDDVCQRQCEYCRKNNKQ
jgi:hypothetical protein